MANNEINFPDKKFIVSKTDLKGRILYGNALFLEMSGYQESELMGAPHNILRHPDMPKLVFKLLWECVQNNKEIFAYVKNKTKNGDYYWVYTHVTPSFDGNGKVVGYHSVRRKPKPEALSTIKALYSSLLDAERSGGVAASKKLLDTKLSQIGKNYDEFIFTL
ncbi:MAG: PAS domain-containing protein [Sulfurimonas sp.]|nr:PAS domain-containing protein [Sulfurimonas sp.]MDD3059816.1 PAS domain-containing protein [Sulfurimonas sp.]MDD5202323.1 PAS domain-containing protein [Sulfurimonas sp.]